MMKLIYISCTILSIIIVFYDLIRYYNNKEVNSLTLLSIKNIYQLENKKKIILFLIILMSIPLVPIFYTILLILSLIFLLGIILLLDKKAEITINKKPESLIIKTSSYYKIREYILYAIVSFLFKIKKFSFFRIYYIFKKDKKINIEMIEHLGFRYIFCIPINYVNHLINILNKNKKKKRKKKLKIRIILMIKDFLITICEIVEDDCFIEYSEIYKIYINNFSIKVNGNGKNIILSKILENQRIHGIVWNEKTKGHILFYNKDTKLYYSLTKSRNVWYTNENGNREYIKTNYLYDIDEKKKQQCFVFEEGQNFDKEYKIYDKIPKNLFIDFRLKYREELLGFLFKNSILQETIDIKEKLIRGSPESRKEKIEINKKEELMDIRKELEKLTNKECYHHLIKNTSDEEKFLLQNKYYEIKRKEEFDDKFNGS